MKIILTADVKGVGKKGETVSVSDGYASNYLIPRKLAVISTSKKSTPLTLNEATNAPYKRCKINRSGWRST